MTELPAGEARDDVAELRTGDRACPFDPLYWHFLTRHRDPFQGNPRMAQMYRTWDRIDDGVRAQVLAEAEGCWGGGRWCRRGLCALRGVGRASARHPEAMAG